MAFITHELTKESLENMVNQKKQIVDSEFGMNLLEDSTEVAHL